jgi:hypothetical protein
MPRQSRDAKHRAEAAGTTTAGRVPEAPVASASGRKALLKVMGAAGLTPVEFLLEVMRDEELPMGSRIDAAKSMAPYLHPRLATTEFTAPGPDKISDAIAELMVRAQEDGGGVQGLLGK